jgi:DNA-binding GntR family transcriptional regulator
MLRDVATDRPGGSMAGSSIGRSVLADQVKDNLLQAILDGRYPPGSRIVETRVAREFGTSQAPVREALRGLEALGVVEILPFRGARIRHPTADELVEAYVVRLQLESLGARLALPRMTDADLAGFETAYDRMRRLADQGDGHAVAVADAQFHGELIRLADNATLERVWRSLEPFSRTYLTLIVPGADAHWTADLHGPILDALRTHDPECVVAALEAHFAAAGARLGAGWSDLGSTDAGRGTHPGGAAADGS